MDIFGTVVGAVELVKSVRQYLISVSNAVEDCSALLSELSALQPLLELLHSRLINGKEINGLPMLIINAGLHQQLNECAATLQTLSIKFESLHPEGRLKTLGFKLLWPFSKGAIESHLKKIDRTKSLVLLTCQASLMDFVSSVEQELGGLGVNVDATKSILMKIEEQQRISANKLESMHVNIQALGFNAAKGLSRLNAEITEVRLVQNAMRRESKTLMGEDNRNKHMAWLSPIDFSTTQSNVYSQLTPGTGKWFLEHPKFQSWLSDESRILWCPGIQGAGKTFIASVTINYMQEYAAASASSDDVVLFLYFNYKTTYTVAEWLRCILKQFGKYRFSTENEEKFITFQKDDKQPVIEELLVMLKSEVRRHSHTFLIIDALDECPDITRNQLIRSLKALDLNILITSRPCTDDELNDLLGCYTTLEISARDEDMVPYIESRIKECRLLTKVLARMSKFKDEIISHITQKADKMFLLAKLHLDALESQSNPNKIKKTLDMLPETLDKTYTDALNRIPEHQRELALRVFSWLTFAFQPLALEDLQYALAVSDKGEEIDADDLDDEQCILSICVGLVTVKDQDDMATGRPTIHFVHYTVQEFFNRNMHLLLPVENIAATCLHYMLSSLIVETPIKDLRELPFVAYAAHGWGYHSKSVLANPQIRALVQKLIEDSQRVRIIGELAYSHEKGFSALHLATFFGLTEVVKDLINSGIDVNAKTSTRSITPIMMASSEDIAELLLKAPGINVNLQSKSGWSALFYAAFRDNWERLVQLILRRQDVDVNIKSIDEWQYTVLCAAVLHGRTSLVQLLLQRPNIDVNCCTKNSKTPLILAAEFHRREIFKLLLQKEEVELNIAIAESGKTALFVAVEKNLQDIVEAMIAIDSVDFNIINKLSGADLIQTAFHKGFFPLARLLFDSGRIRLPENSTVPFCLAVVEEDMETAMNTIDCGYDLICSPNFVLEEAALRYALDNDADIKVVQYFTQLASKSDETPVPGHFYNELIRHPILIAMKKSDIRILKTLIDGGFFNVNCQTYYCGVAALHMAAEAGNVEQMSLILGSRGVNVDIEDAYGDTPLIYAARSGQFVAVEVLLRQTNANIGHKNTKRQTAFDIARESGHTIIADYIVMKKSDIRMLKTFNINYQTYYCGVAALHMAAEAGDVKQMSLILGSREVNVDIEDAYGDTPLIYAARSGQFTAVEVLLRQTNANIGHKNTKRQTAFDIAREAGHTIIADYIVVVQKHRRLLFKSIAVASYAFIGFNSTKHRVQVVT